MKNNIFNKLLNNRRNEFLVLGIMLSLLHLYIWADLPQTQGLAVLIVQFGFFLLWQPIWQTRHEFQLFQITIPLALFLLSYLWVENWLVTLWLILLTGLIGSRILYEGRIRPSYLLTIMVIVIELVIGLVPQLIKGVSIPIALQTLFQYLLGFLILVITLSRSQKQPLKQIVELDLLHGLLTAMLVSLVALGSLFLTNLADTEYLDALITSTFVIAFLLLSISWLWNPRVGFSGLGALWNRYQLTIGGPFEEWVTKLSSLTEDPELSAHAFLKQASKLLLEQDWINGVHWLSDDLEFIDGKQKGHNTEFHLDMLSANVFCNTDPGDALERHTYLLLRIVDQFYVSRKLHAEQKIQAQLHAIHSTGARLTHDIKNLVQSTQGLLAAADSIDVKREGELKQLLQKQLPLINTRLEKTLQKLKKPSTEDINVGNAADWWQTIMHRYETRPVSFQTNIEKLAAIPIDLFDSVLENLLENCFQKKLSEPDINIKASISINADGITLRVEDTGSIISTHDKEKLFLAPTESGQGLGVGLHQCSAMAKQLGYTLKLASNKNGCVCFELSSHQAN